MLGEPFELGDRNELASTEANVQLDVLTPDVPGHAERRTRGSTLSASRGTGATFGFARSAAGDLEDLRGWKDAWSD